MLQKQNRKQLEQHSWLQIEKKDSNPRSSLRRYKDHSITAINDLSLIAQKLPEDTVSEIFTYDNVKKIIESILNRENSPDHLETVSSCDMNSQRTHLAALLVEEGIKICIEKYRVQNRETPILSEATVGQLNQAIKICNEIAYMVDLPTRKESENDLEYLFNWNRVPGPDDSKFIAFIESIFGSIYENFKDDGIFSHEIRKYEPPVYSYDSLEELRAANEGNQRTSEIVLNVLDSYHSLIGYFSFRLKYSSRTINLQYIKYNQKGTEIDTSNIILKQDYGNFYIYRRKSSR